MGDEPGEVIYNVGKFIALGGRNPLQSQPLGRETNEPHQLLHHPRPLCRNVVALTVMTLPYMASSYEDAVRTFLKSFENKMGRYTAAAHDTNGQNRCLVF